MELRLFTTVFTTVFLAELGDKTQLATVLYAADGANHKWTVFAGSAAALVVASGLGVFAGSKLGPLVNGRALEWVAGVGFIAIGIWTIVKG